MWLADGGGDYLGDDSPTPGEHSVFPSPKSPRSIATAHAAMVSQTALRTATAPPPDTSLESAPPSPSPFLSISSIDHGGGAVSSEHLQLQQRQQQQPPPRPHRSPALPAAVPSQEGAASGDGSPGELIAAVPPPRLRVSPLMMSASQAPPALHGPAAVERVVVPLSAGAQWHRGSGGADLLNLAVHGAPAKPTPVRPPGPADRLAESPALSSFAVAPAVSPTAKSAAIPTPTDSTLTLPWQAYGVVGRVLPPTLPPPLVSLLTARPPPEEVAAGVERAQSMTTETTQRACARLISNGAVFTVLSPDAPPARRCCSLTF